ncbi:hypothetical protein MRX96_039043 [Rhipicephalus microplus]
MVAAPLAVTHDLSRTRNVATGCDDEGGITNGDDDGNDGDAGGVATINREQGPVLISSWVPPSTRPPTQYYGFPTSVAHQEFSPDRQRWVTFWFTHRRSSKPCTWWPRHSPYHPICLGRKKGPQGETTWAASRTTSTTGITKALKSVRQSTDASCRPAPLAAS